jgi:hypothetical protein
MCLLEQQAEQEPGRRGAGMPLLPSDQVSQGRSALSFEKMDQQALLGQEPPQRAQGLLVLYR